jgi:hypothetical protein
VKGIQKKVLTENKEEDLLQMIASLNQYSEHGAQKTHKDTTSCQ